MVNITLLRLMTLDEHPLHGENANEHDANASASKKQAGSTNLPQPKRALSDNSEIEALGICLLLLSLYETRRARLKM